MLDSYEGIYVQHSCPIKAQVLVAFQKPQVKLCRFLAQNMGPQSEVC